MSLPASCFCNYVTTKWSIVSWCLDLMAALTWSSLGNFFFRCFKQSRKDSSKKMIFLQSPAVQSLGLLQNISESPIFFVWRLLSCPSLQKATLQKFPYHWVCRSTRTWAPTVLWSHRNFRGQSWCLLCFCRCPKDFVTTQLLSLKPLMI